MLVFVSLYYWAACRTSPVEISVFGHLCRKRTPGGGKTRGSCTEKPCSQKWFRRIFPCTDPCTNIFCSSPRPETRKALQIKKAICVVRSDSIIGSLYKFCHCSSLSQLMLLVLKNRIREILTLHTNPHAVHGRFTLKDNCERQFWNGLCREERIIDRCIT